MKSKKIRNRKSEPTATAIAAILLELNENCCIACVGHTNQLFAVHHPRSKGSKSQRDHSFAIQTKRPRPTIASIEQKSKATQTSQPYQSTQTKTNLIFLPTTTKLNKITKLGRPTRLWQQFVRQQSAWPALALER